MVDLRRVTREFLLGESFGSPSIKSYIQSLEEILSTIKPNSQKNMRKLEIAKQHLKEIRINVRRLEERVNILEEQVSILEEDNSDILDLEKGDE